MSFIGSVSLKYHVDQILEEKYNTLTYNLPFKLYIKKSLLWTN